MGCSELQFLQHVLHLHTLIGYVLLINQIRIYQIQYVQKHLLLILSFVGTIKITLEFIKVRLDILATNSQLEFGNIATEYGAINNVQLTGV